MPVEMSDLQRQNIPEGQRSVGKTHSSVTWVHSSFTWVHHTSCCNAMCVKEWLPGVFWAPPSSVCNKLLVVVPGFGLGLSSAKAKGTWQLLLFKLSYSYETMPSPRFSGSGVLQALVGMAALFPVS